MENKPNISLFQTIVDKSTLKQNVFANTLQTLNLFKHVVGNLTADYKNFTSETSVNRNIAFESKDRGDFEIEVKFGGDILIFLMHTNIFEFPREHVVMRTAYIQQDKQRSYCGVINIYNFLADSFKYNRVNDVGYLIGRVFVNKDNHYFIEGKRELGFLYNDFGKHEMNLEAAEKIVEAAILYTINFDLLTPPYETVKMVTVSEMMNTFDTITVRTGKRLGFQFQQDIEGKKEM